MSELRIKRVYESAEESDGIRVLVDRLWPRGITKTNAQIDIWLKDIAPSDRLRRLFHASPTSFEEFRQSYKVELKSAEGRRNIAQILDLLERSPVTLLYAARSIDHNNATVLMNIIKQSRKRSQHRG